MNIILWVKGNRGLQCLRRMISDGYRIQLMVLQPQPKSSWYIECTEIARKEKLDLIAPDDPNSYEVEAHIKSLNPHLLILAGYGGILGKGILTIPQIMCINLHGGRLPEYRGSSPMNWVLVNGESSFGISIIEVTEGVDTGNILNERIFDISEEMTIRDLHKIADTVFPEMLLETITQIQTGLLVRKQQKITDVGYYPLRFPEDGLIFWDMLTAKQIHNRIRALTEPYPCAYSYYKGRKIRLISSKMRNTDYFGEPGRIYMKKDGRLLVCAVDKCLWITSAQFIDNNQELYPAVSRYDCLGTAKTTLEILYERGLHGSFSEKDCNENGGLHEDRKF